MHVCTRYLRGGSERRVADIIAALPEVEHHVIVGEDSDLPRARRELHPAEVSHEPLLVRSVQPGRDALALARMVTYLRSRPVDIVYTHQSKAGAIGRAAAWLAGGPPTVHSLSMANFGPAYGWLEDRVFRLLERTLAARTDAYSVVGTDLARRYEQIRVPADKLRVVRSGVRMPPRDRTAGEARAALAAAYGIPQDRPLIVYLGSLDERKSVLSLPDYLAAVAARTARPPFLLVAGDGPLHQPLQDRLVATGQADDARLLGFVTPVDDLVVGADALVLLSIAEGLPQVLVMAAAAGTPFISYDVDGVAELLALGAAGSAVPLRDVQAAAEATVPHVNRAGTPRPAPPLTLRAALGEWSANAILQGHREVFVAALARRREAAQAPRSRTRLGRDRKPGLATVDGAWVDE